MTSTARPSARRWPRTQTAWLTELAGHAWMPAAEFGTLVQDPIFWGWGVPRGDGHPVLVLPGLGGGDTYLSPLHGWLRRLGYAPVRSEIERNPGWSAELVSALTAIVEREHTCTGRMVSIVGHSMGGLLGRSVAARRPELVRRVITLGAPLAMARSPLPASVPLIAITSPDDRIVRAGTATPRDRHARRISVPGSHLGLAVNRHVYRHLARLLAERTDGRREPSARSVRAGNR